MYYNLFVGIILQFIFSGKCKADSACDKTTGKCLDDTGCAKGKLDFISVSWKKLYFLWKLMIFSGYSGDDCMAPNCPVGHCGTGGGICVRENECVCPGLWSKVSSK